MSNIDKSCSLKELLLSMNFSKSQITKRLSKKELNKKINYQESFYLPIDLVNTMMISTNYSGKPIEILFEDDDYLALSKPEGVDGHSLNYSDESCLSFLRKSGYRDIINIQMLTHERGMLYRLDKVTSGVLVFAKNLECFNNVRNNFLSVVKEKVYYALVKEKVDLSGEQIHFFTPTGTKGSKIKVSNSEGDEGRLTILSCQFNSEQNTTLIQVKLITGLRHQIRSQLAFLGHPIIGDELYGGEKSSRVFLHAYSYKINELEFVDDSYLAIFSKATS